MQLSFLPGLARRGALRAQIEAVRVRHDYRSRGLGVVLFEWAIEEARRRNCALVQLTTDKSRADAHRFYERLGFVASHEARAQVAPLTDSAYGIPLRHAPRADPALRHNDWPRRA